MRTPFIALLLAAATTTPALAAGQGGFHTASAETAAPVQLAMLQRGGERRERRFDRRQDRQERRFDRYQDRQERRFDRREPNSRQERRFDRYQDRQERRFDRTQDRQDRRFDRRQDQRRWSRDWRSDRRYDWRGHRDRYRTAYRPGRYYAPYRGNSYRRYGIGFNLGTAFYGQRYWISDPYRYRLPQAYGGYRWVRYYNDVILVDVHSGYIDDVIYDFFY